MKNFLRKIREIFNWAFDSFVDGLFLIRLLYDLKQCKRDKDGYITELRVLLQFFEKSFDKSAFEFYQINNEEYLYWFYYSLKHKNNSIFQVFLFCYCFTINHFLVPVLELFIYYFPKKIQRIYHNSRDIVGKKIQHKIENNFGYEYLREYKKYYKNYPKSWNKIKYKVFLKETFLNLCIWWNNKTKINTDKIDIEKWF